MLSTFPNLYDLYADGYSYISKKRLSLIQPLFARLKKGRLDSIRVICDAIIHFLNGLTIRFLRSSNYILTIFCRKLLF